MSFKSTCPFCDQSYEVDDSMLGQAATCTKCNNAFVLQVDDDAVAPFTPGGGNVGANTNSPASPPKGKRNKMKRLIISLVVIAGIMAVIAIWPQNTIPELSDFNTPSAPTETFPPPDAEKIAAHKQNGVNFSGDNRTLLGVDFIDYGKNRFYSHTPLFNVTEYTIPAGVTAIERYAFRRSKNLKKITIPDSMMTIGDEAFPSQTQVIVSPKNRYFFTDDCGALIDRMNKRILHLPFDFSGAYKIPRGVKIIAPSTFKDHDNLTSVTFPSSVETIGKSAFENCIKLSNITISSGVKTIEDSAFSGCENLTSITIPSSVKTIGGSAFKNCKNLTSITIPSSVTIIGGSAFSHCKNLTSITIPSSVTAIEDFAFYSCENLTSITIPSSVKTIGKWAFRYCKNLKSVTIPSGVATIEECAFSDCENLKSVTIPSSVSTIGYGAFSSCENLTSITIPSSVKTIGKSAFENCKNLTSITIPSSVKTIGKSAFENCKNLTSITIPSSVSTIEEDAFSGCSRLANVTISDNMTVIKKDAFKECPCETWVKQNFPNYGKYW